MRKIKIITVIGARPQFVKAGALSRVFADTELVEEILVHTGQHFDENMSDVFFDEMNIPKPKYNLAINSLNHGAMTGRMLEGIEEILVNENPDLVLIYGDTNSTLAGALAAKKLHIKVAHVEAGLRSFNMQMPEEVNRILTDRISDFLFCPTEAAVENLMNEGYSNLSCDVIKCGDVMQDAAYYYAQVSAKKSHVVSDSGMNRYGLVTLHRAENTDDVTKLTAIVNALNYVHQHILPLVLPLHPRTLSKLNAYDLKLELKTISPVGYFDMIELIKNADLVMTDSGGLQKEAYFFKKPCITMREQTEWVELIEAGVNVLVGSNYDQIVAAAESGFTKDVNFDKDLYGGGVACQNILNHLLANL